MKHLLTIFGFLAIAFAGFSQGPDYTDLRILYADQDYEKLAKEAEKYTTNDKTKKDVLPYFWLAKGLYKISLSGSDDDRFKNAYKDAIKYLGKGITYDNKYNDGGAMVQEREFVGTFQMSLAETIINEMITDNFKRAFGWAIKYQKITNNEIAAYYTMGACKFYDNDKTSARDYWTKADKMLGDIESIEDWSDADKRMLKMGVLFSAKALKDSKQDSKASDLVGKVSQWFEEDPDWQAQYDEIVNGVE